MIQPKIFYRDFDNLLKNIRHKKSGKNYLCSILSEVQNNFGDALNFSNLSIYEEKGDDFVLVSSLPESSQFYKAQNLSKESPAVQQVLKNGTFIFDEKKYTLVPEKSSKSHSIILAAMVIRGPVHRWLVLFELQSGWVRDEVLFSLNAIRTAVNYRLFSDAVQNELQQAAQIQKSLLPQQLPQIKGYQIAVRAYTTEIVGGDLYDFFEFDDNNFGVCIGDASGHGIPAALLVRDIVIGLRMGLEKHMKMVYTFLKLNSVIYRSTYSSRFVSLFYGEIEQDGHLIYINAGHPAPFLVSGKKVIELEATGLILGALPEITLHRSYTQIEPDAVLVMFSDGIFERLNQKDAIFGIPRLKQLVIENQKKDAHEIVDILCEHVYRFGNRSKWEDDSTLLVIKRERP